MASFAPSLGAISAAQNPVRFGFSLALVVLVVILFTLSGGVLWALGLNYEGLTGSAASKIHPFTYLVIFVVGCYALTARRVLSYFSQTVQRTPAGLLLVVAGMALFGQIVGRNGAGMAGAIDTYLGPGLLLMLLGWANETELRKVEVTLHTVMGINAAIALVEFATDTRFFPYRFDGEFFPSDARSTALQGHPLINAIVTACYVLALLNGGRALPTPLKIPMIGLQLAALVAFGGRSEVVVTLLLGCLFLLMRTRHLIRAPRVSLLGASGVVLLISLAPIAIIPPLSAGGFFDALLSRFASDGGSANARLEMFDLFSQIPLRDLLIGPDLDFVDGLRRVSGLEWGIENPIVKTMLYQGVFTTILLTTAVALFLREAASRCQRGVWLPLLAFSILLMTAETIGGKTTLLAKFIVIALSMYRPRSDPPSLASSDRVRQ
jgi:hypothetical protein